MSVRGAAVFLRVGYVAGHGYKRDQAMSQLGHNRTCRPSIVMSALLRCVSLLLALF